MRKVVRSIAVVAAVLLPSALAMAQERLPERRRPATQDWQDHVNAAFGRLLDWVGYLPFYNVANAWFGIDTSPQPLRDDAGNPTVSSLTLAGHQGGVEYATFGHTGRRVLTSDGAHDVRVFSLFRANWRQQEPTAPDPLLAVLKGHTDTVTAIELFPDPPGAIRFTDDFFRLAEVLTASRDGTARIFRLATPDQRDPHAQAPREPVVREAEFVLQHGAPVASAGYSPSGTWVVTVGADGSVVLWDEHGREAKRFTGAEQGVVSWAFSGGESHIGLLDGTGSLRVFALGSALPAIVKTGTTPPPTRVTADGETFTVHDGKVETSWTVGTGETGTQLEGPTQVPAAPAGEPAPRVAIDQGRAILHARATQYPLGSDATTTGSSFGAGATRVLTFGSSGEVRVWEWLVRGPTGELASVGIPFVVLWLVLAAVLFTLFFRFVNVRMFKHAIRCVMGKYSDPNDVGEVSHFQALSAALSATVGLGNIAGVAIAVMIGGPGATFWMIVAGLLGMTLKFTECTLGQMFRRIDQNGNVSGGPMHYLRDGLALRGLGGLGAPLAVIFSVFCIGGSLAGGNAFQVNQSLGILRGQVPFFEQQPWVYGVGMAFFTGIVIIGGIRSIARVADKIVPLMCGLYVLSALTVIVLHVADIPAAVGAIFQSALSGDAVYGGAIGALVMGFRRAAFSNEAGVGSASIAHSAARTPYPVREGIVALLEPFIDTVVVCTMTALVIGISGVYKAPEHAEIIAATNGAALTTQAFESVPLLKGWFGWVLMVAVVLFAYSTMISWSYYGERCATNLFGPRASLPFKFLFLLFTVLGSIVTATNVLEFGDLMILLMAFPNILGLYILGGFVRRDLREYEQKLQSGEIHAYR